MLEFYQEANTGIDRYWRVLPDGTEVLRPLSEIIGGGVTSVNGLNGAIVFAAGTNITLTPVGNTITIDASGGGGGTPGAPFNSVQFNSAGSFAGSANFLYDTTIGGRFQVSSSAGFGLGIVSDPANGRYVMGDYGGNANHFQLVIDDANRLWQAFAPNGVFQAGDIAGIGNSTNINIQDNGLRIDMSAEGFVVLGDTHGRGYVVVEPGVGTRKVTIGDRDQNFNETRWIVDDLNSLMLGIFNNTFTLQDTSNNKRFFIDINNGLYEMGDLSNSANNTKLIVDDVAQAYILNMLGSGGLQMVTADNNGRLGVQAIPTGTGTVTGTGFVNQVAYWSGGSAIAGDNNFLWIPGQKTFSVGDLSGSQNHVKFIVDDFNSDVSVQKNGNKYLDLDFTNGVFTFGDVANFTNGTYLYIDNVNRDMLFNGKYNSIANSPFVALNWQQGTTLLGDSNVSNHGTSIWINDVAQTILIKNDMQTIVQSVGGVPGFVADLTNHQYGFGDLTLVNNGFRSYINDTFLIMDFSAPLGAARFGDNDALGHGTQFIVSDVLQEIISNRPIRVAGYTVATLPAGTQGDTAYVTDALLPGFLTIVVGGGAVKTPVFFNGANWVAY